MYPCEYIISGNVREYAGIYINWFSLKSFTRLIARGCDDQNALSMAAAQEETASLSYAWRRFYRLIIVQLVHKLELHDMAKGVIAVRLRLFVLPTVLYGQQSTVGSANYGK